MPPHQTRLSAADWLALIALSVLWGGSFLFGRIAVAEIPPLTLELCRVGLAAAALHIVIRLRGLRLPDRWGDFIAMGALKRGIYQCLACHLDDSHQRHDHGRSDPGRNYHQSAARRYCADRIGSRGHRRAITGPGC